MTTRDARVKTCPVCGRDFAWRRRWAKTWEQVRYCSEGCRRGGVSASDRALERAILDLLRARAADATICPSEAARAVGGAAWRGLLEPARRAGRRLAAQGVVRFTQGGRAVDPTRARGPIRIARAGGFGR